MEEQTRKSECTKRGCEPGEWQPYEYGNKQTQHCIHCGRVLCVATMPEGEGGSDEKTRS